MFLQKYKMIKKFKDSLKIICVFKKNNLIIGIYFLRVLLNWIEFTYLLFSLFRIGGCSRIENNECANCQGEFGYDPSEKFCLSYLCLNFSASFKKNVLFSDKIQHLPSIKLLQIQFQNKKLLFLFCYSSSIFPLGHIFGNVYWKKMSFFHTNKQSLQVAWTCRFTYASYFTSGNYLFVSLSQF